METNKLNFTDAKVRIDHRNRNRMKITIKLSASDAESYQSFMQATKPGEVSEEDYARNIFFMGCETFQERLTAAVANYTAPEVEIPTVGETSPLVNPDEEV
jgi:hypothetical protein